MSSKQWFLVGIISWVFFSTMAAFIYWTLTGASWWLRDVGATAVFVQGMAIMFWGTEMWDRGKIIAVLNTWLACFGLALTTTQRLSDLEQQELELAVLSAHLYPAQYESEVHHG